MENFIPIFKKDEDKKFIQLVEETAKYMLEIRMYGEYLLTLLRKEEKLKINMIVLAIIVEFLKKLDNVSSLIKNHSFNSIMPTLREIFELKVQIFYLLEKEEEIKIRTLAYEYFGYYRRYNDAKKMLKVISNIDREKALNPKEEIYSKLNENEALKQESLFNSKVMKNAKFSKIHEIVTENNTIKKKKKNHYMKWYEVGSNLTNIGKLCNHLGIRSYYEIYYNAYSLDTHGLLNIENNIDFSEKGKAFLKNPNEPNKEIIKNIMTFVDNEADNVYNEIIIKLLPKNYLDSYIQWQINHSGSSTEERLGYKSKKQTLIEQWNDYFNSYK